MPLKLLVLLEKLSYQGRESEGGVWQSDRCGVEAPADDGKGFEAQRSMSKSEGSFCRYWAQRPWSVCEMNIL